MSPTSKGQESRPERRDDQTEPSPAYEANPARKCVFRERKTRFIELLHWTPPQTVCPNFYLLSHANGCAFMPQCMYCYLKSSFWFLPKPHVFTNTDDLEKQVRAWIQEDDLEAYVLNSGNMSDSLAFEGSRPIMSRLVSIFAEEAEAQGRPHCLLIVTKGGREQAKGFLFEEPCRNVIVSFSVNAAEAAARFERGAASTAERLAAMRELKERGWRIRVRIDPMIRGFDYRDLIAEVKALRPERVTAGAIRVEPNLKRHGGNPLFDDLVLADADLFRRYPEKERVEMYRNVSQELLPVCEVGLCEEGDRVWRASGLDPTGKTCNCGL